MNSQNKLSALKFVKPNENLHQQYFSLILELTILAHNSLMEQESGIDGLSEETLRNKLLKHMDRNRGRKGLGRFEFNAETIETNENTDATIGYTDMKITIPSKNDFTSEEKKYYTLECKRLDGHSNKNKSYIDEGIFRFIKGKYSKKMNMAGMIGFVESSTKKFKDDKIVSIVKDINEKLENDFKRPNEKLQNTIIVDNFSSSYTSTHTRDKNLGNINITHLLFDNTLAN